MGLKDERSHNYPENSLVGKQEELGRVQRSQRRKGREEESAPIVALTQAVREGRVLP